MKILLWYLSWTHGILFHINYAVFDNTGLVCIVKPLEIFFWDKWVLYWKIYDEKMVWFCSVYWIKDSIFFASSRMKKYMFASWQRFAVCAKSLDVSIATLLLYLSRTLIGGWILIKITLSIIKANHRQILHMMKQIAIRLQAPFL